MVNTSDVFYNETEHEVEKLVSITSLFFFPVTGTNCHVYKSKIFIELGNIRLEGMSDAY